MVGRWISVDTPPTENCRCLVCVKTLYGHLVMVADYALNLHEVDDFVFEDEHRAGFYVADDEVMYYEIPGVTHWMSLPDPPEEIQE